MINSFRLLKDRKSKKGFSLLEILLVLGAIAALIVAAFMIFPKVQASQRIDRESRNLTAIQAGVKSLYGGRAKISSINTNSFIASKNAPENMIQDGKLINEWKGNVQVEYSGNHGKYNIIYDAVPASDCSKLIAAVSGNFVSIDVYNGNGGTQVKNLEEGKNIDIAATSAACFSEDNATIIFASII
ncbi:TPA: prepilin-type N-terminal cleavage/methylation domain-containing protein [Klebsiella quasipneumoniae]|uniref:type 4 pilus major pilin n=1 Tax=Escherichia coli TaxID=562 RepID=UPI0019CFD10E|nr:type 4 pilus major pilin [Escherichia coli]MBN6628763.1 prepilin-type N-terminal cleavage/methylation domain-containing protein [Escherichia coli]HBR0320470.1 prepilin-type N-terminal cleavage/methylation domain-containing protein [Klebsiella quasipneumoniae]